MSHLSQSLSKNNLATARRALKAEAELRKTNNDLRARERERDAAEARASAAQAESDRGTTNSNALAAARRVSLNAFKTNVANTKSCQGLICYCKHVWAARYNTWLLIKLTPKGIVFSFLFLIANMMSAAMWGSMHADADLTSRTQCDSSIAQTV